MSSNEFVLIYHQGIAGRGEFVRLMLEELGLKYTENHQVANIRAGEYQGFPCFAPPILQCGDFQLSQTPVICKYLGSRFGLMPEKPEDAWHAAQLDVTLHDYFYEGMLSFHGKDFCGSYYDQIEETKPHIETFKATRIPKFMKYFETVLSRNNDGKGYLFGGKLTYVDVTLLHILRVTASQFPQQWQEADYIPLLKAFKTRMEERPNLKAYFNSKRCQPFCGNSMC